ncbi:thiamine-phosphate kinase [Minwuia sp.]|uniref:thiamine-phosphate kinase n=1 Tax=Minwuia sp. TaxID=2493630 RepID=UPI003A9570EE
MSGFGEFEFIADLLAPLAGDTAFNLTDDAALLPRLGHGEAWTVTKDAMVEGVHFLPDDPADLIARKLLRVNLSDLAAMGARPAGYMLSLSLDRTKGRDWLASFCAGLAEDQRTFVISLFGGDTTSTPGPASFSLTAFGAVRRGAELRRNGAQPGDRVFVSGTLGDAALGLRVLQQQAVVSDQDADYLGGRYRLPQPRVALGQALVGRASACLDVSDGLLADLGHIAKHSAVGIEIDLAAVPVSDATRRLIGADPDLAHIALNGGDDYELAFTLPAGAGLPEAAVQVTQIGRVIDGAGVKVMRDGQPVTVNRPGWRHF